MREDRGRGLFDGNECLLGLETDGRCNGVERFGPRESTALQNELGRKGEVRKTQTWKSETTMYGKRRK